MRDYDELVKALRGFDIGESCPCETPEMCEGKDCMVIQAADAIEELVAAVPKWISVEESLPEIGRIVLLFNGAVQIGWRVDGKRYRVLSERFPDHPTHWMPLPDPPKEVE